MYSIRKKGMNLLLLKDKLIKATNPCKDLIILAGKDGLHS